MGSSEKRTRGPNKQTPWARKPEDGLSVLRLALDTSDPVQRRFVEAMFSGAFSVYRAVQRGARVDKLLRDRVHRCPTCGLCGDRDAVAAVLASFVVFERPGEPASASVDYAASAAALPARRSAFHNPFSGWQDTLSESTDLSAREGSFLAWRTSTPDPVVVARRNVAMARRPTLNEPGISQTTSARAQMQTNMFTRHDLDGPYLWDKS